jgi:hypothetical protein
VNSAIRPQISPKPGVGAPHIVAKDSETGSCPLLVALVRILARVAARDCLGQFRTEPTAEEASERKRDANLLRSDITRQDQPS